MILNSLTSIELCAGAGGQALGLEAAGFSHQAAVEIDRHCQETLKLNRPEWNVVSGEDADLWNFSGKRFEGVDLVAGGLPCPPFSIAGKQLGEQDERNLFPPALRIIEEIKPKAVMIENVRGFLSGSFEDYRTHLKGQFRKLGYEVDWRLLNASDFGVPQLRPRVVIVALKPELTDFFSWPSPLKGKPPTVADTLIDLMKANNWVGAAKWAALADDIAPTLVGGSKKHGGADLGPTRAKKAWLSLGVDGKGIANDAPEKEFVGIPRLTLRMAARIQGFPDDWQFAGGKTSAYRQIGNAFPPPVAAAVAKEIEQAITKSASNKLAI